MFILLDLYISLHHKHGLETMALARTRSEIRHLDRFCLAFIIGACCGHIYSDNVVPINQLAQRQIIL
jgi:hypothetical protein